MKHLTKHLDPVLVSATALLALALAGCDAVPELGGSSAASSDRGTGNADAGSVAEALDEESPYARARQLGALLPTLGPEALPQVKEALDRSRLELGAAEFELLLRFWATYEPAEATAWTFKHSSPIYRASATSTVVEMWAEADPEAAVVAVESALAESSEEVARVALSALVYGWFKTDREALQEYILGLGAGIKRQRALFAYVLALMRADGSEGVMRWVESLPDEDRRYKLAAYRQAMSALSWADMPAALRFCEAHCDGPYGKGLRNVLIRTRLRNGEYGGDVVAWAGSVPAETETQQKNKQHSLWVAFATWAYREPEEALRWIEEKLAEEEPEPWLHHLYGEYARQIAVDSPAKAMEWAERIEDDADRVRTMIRIVRAWRLQDEEAAEAWLSQSPLSEEAREQARNTRAPLYLPGLNREQREQGDG